MNRKWSVHAPRSCFLSVEALEERQLLDSSYHRLLDGVLWQDWSDTSLLRAENSWAAVPSIVGYRGDRLTTTTGVDPRTVRAFGGPGGPVVEVAANRTNPNASTTRGVAEFHLADPVVALQGSTTARAPALVFHLDTTGVKDVTFYFVLRDLDGSADNARSQVAVQYRVGETGDFINFPDSYVQDATTGPNQASLVTPLYGVLPAAAQGHGRVQVRVLTTDAVGSDEWVGVDDLVFWATPDETTSELRFVSYNIASYGGAPRTGLDTILEAIAAENVAGRTRPIDVLALQEVQSQVKTTEHVVTMLNATHGDGVYARGSLDGDTTGAGTQGLVYNTRTVQLLGEAAIGMASTTGQPRQALRYHLRPVGTDGSADFYVYNSHMNASSGTTNQTRRRVEAEALRADADSLGEGVNVLFVGDFNVYRSGESAYQRLLSAGAGQAIDPLNRPGSWHSNAAFVDLMTQAPAIDPPGGLTGGGLDDRFDFQLLSAELTDGFGLDYRPETYHAFGNNGSVPLNAAIDDPLSTALAGLPNRLEVLWLLTTVSDHLPVVADYGIIATAPAAMGTRAGDDSAPSMLGQAEVLNWLSGLERTRRFNTPGTVSA